MHPASVWFINVKRQRNVNCHLVFIPVLLDCKKHSNVTRSHFWKCNASVYSYSPFILNKITVALLNCLNIWCVIFVLNAIFLYVKKQKLTTRNCIYASHLGLFFFFFFSRSMPYCHIWPAFSTWCSYEFVWIYSPLCWLKFLLFLFTVVRIIHQKPFVNFSSFHMLSV